MKSPHEIKFYAKKGSGMGSGVNFLFCEVNQRQEELCVVIRLTDTESHFPQWKSHGSQCQHILHPVVGVFLYPVVISREFRHFKGVW